jgi:hypothetical protein
VFDKFIPLRSALGLQLWLGNNDAYRDSFPGWLHPIDNVAEREKYIAMGEAAYMEEKQKQAMAWILSHPRREAQLFRERFIATWAGTAHPIRDFRQSSSVLVRMVLLCNSLAAVGALIGMVIVYTRPHQREYAIPLTAFPVVFPFAFYFSQALFRYRYPIDPNVLLLASIAAVGLIQGAEPNRDPSAP